MSYQNFKPLVWADGIEEDLEAAHVFVADTNRDYEGKIAKLGDSIKILGVGRPTILSGSNGKVKLGEVESVADTSVTMPILHWSTANYEVGNIDKAQAQEKSILDVLSKESTYGLANEHDLLVAGMAKDPIARKLESSSTSISTDNILSYIDKGLEALYDNDVKPENPNITITVPPWFWTILKQAYIKLDTNNSTMLKNGHVAMYGNVKVRLSNNVAKDTNGNSLIQLKTNKAIAFAEQLNQLVPYSPEKDFADAIKALSIYDAKLVRNKEMVVLNCKRGA